ncbi:hypothetical protein GCM10027053_51560 [Intrasporangium mesophilum]
MKHKRRLLTIAALAAAAAAPLLAGAGPAQSASPFGKLLSGPPCEAAKHAKPGTGWVCIDPVASKARHDMLPAPHKAAGATKALDGHVCTVSGCFDVYSTVQASYSGVGHYGVADSSGFFREIGQVKLDLTDTLNGGKFIHKPFCWSSTASTANLYLIVERYSMTPPSSSTGKFTTGGSPLSPRVRVISPTKTLASAGTGMCLAASGNKNNNGVPTDNTTVATANTYYTSYHYVTWKDTHGYPGKWWMQAKMVVAYKRSDSAAYWFYQDADTKIPLDAANGGYLP